jgi:NAD-dependent DNA ligase
VFETRRSGNVGSAYLAYCAGNHKHEWYKCKCGRNICKVSFRNYFGYEINDQLFDNDLVDKSHYSKRTKALLGLHEDGFKGDEVWKGTPVPVYATMETIEKVWGKMPRYRRNPYRLGWGPSSDFIHYYTDETTRPKLLRAFDMSDATFSIEEIHNRFLEAKKRHEEQLEVQALWEVSGIGDVTVEKLLKKFRNADKVFSATAEEIAKAPGISEGRARQIRKKLDDHPKEYGQEYRDKKRKKPFTYRDWNNPSYTYRAESFESTEGKKGD